MQEGEKTKNEKEERARSKRGRPGGAESDKAKLSLRG